MYEQAQLSSSFTSPRVTYLFLIGHRWGGEGGVNVTGHCYLYHHKRGPPHNLRAYTRYAIGRTRRRAVADCRCNEGSNWQCRGRWRSRLIKEEAR
jgi:hypothetical protein